MVRQFENPNDEFVAFVISDFYQGKKTKQVIERFNGLVKKSIKQYFNDILNDKLKAAIANTNAETDASNIATKEVAATELMETPQIVTTEEELEGYVTIKFLLKETIPIERLYYRDNLSYFNILLDDNIRKWICRLGLNSATNKYIQFNDEERTTININSLEDLIEHKDKLIEVTEKFL